MACFQAWSRSARSVEVYSLSDTIKIELLAQNICIQTYIHGISSWDSFIAVASLGPLPKRHLDLCSHFSVHHDVRYVIGILTVKLILVRV